MDAHFFPSFIIRSNNKKIKIQIKIRNNQRIFLTIGAPRFDRSRLTVLQQQQEKQQQSVASFIIIRGTKEEEEVVIVREPNDYYCVCVHPIEAVATTSTAAVAHC